MHWTLFASERWDRNTTGVCGQVLSLRAPCSILPASSSTALCQPQQGSSHASQASHVFPGGPERVWRSESENQTNVWKTLEPGIIVTAS